MGEVYRANDYLPRRDVAIKISNARFSHRSERKARAIAALNHPNTCQIYDVDSFDLMRDGKHVVAVPAGEIRQSTHAVFLLNFMDELRWRFLAKR